MKVNTLIEGYSEMSAEDKLKALEEFEIADPDYSGYVKKSVFDTTAHELAEKKKELKAKLTDDEAEKQKQKEEQETLQANYEKLLRDSTVSKNKAKLLAMGYEEKLADETAEAMADNDTEKIFASQRKHLDAVEKKVKADALKDTPPPVGGEGSKTMTLEKLQKLSKEERLDFYEKNKAEYNTLYGVTEQSQ